jgi:N-formylglutamate deformylase
MEVAPFECIEPANGTTPVVVEVPHAGLWIDGETAAFLEAPARAIARDADLYVDELASEAPLEGASLLVARVSRYVVDLNREPADFDGLSVAGGTAGACPRGVIWRLTADDEAALDKPLPIAEYDRRMARYYRPYHEALGRLVAQKRERFGGVVVVNLHSMPSVGKSLASRQMMTRADVVLGTRGQSTASRALISMVEEYARGFGWSVAHDDPYRGGATTARLGRPDTGVHAIQVELARRLYMSETSLARKNGTFGVTKAFCRGLVARIGAAALG